MAKEPIFIELVQWHDIIWPKTLFFGLIFNLGFYMKTCNMLANEIAKFFNRFHVMVLISMLLLNITLTLISTYKYYTPEYKAFEEEKQKLISLWSENPLAYDSLYEVHVEKVDSYNSLVRQASIMGRASPEFENQYINSKEYDDIELFDSVEETIVESRSSHGSTIFCTQFETAGWYKRINPDPESDSPLTEAIIDRPSS